jgi:CRP-like cAMP-binding protein
MDIVHRVMALRKTALFEDLPGEVLLTIAEESETREIAQGQRIFSQGDYSDGLYVVVSGAVEIRKDGQVISELGKNGFFGEIGILDDSPRVGDAIAQTEATLLFIEKEVFNSITEDLPEVLRAVTKTVIGYLKKQ